MSEPTAPPTAEQADAQVALADILADKNHPYYHAEHPDAPQAVEDVLALRRVAAGDTNRVLVTYREGDEPSIEAPAQPFTIDRRDLPALAPGSWTPSQVDRVISTAMDQVGATAYETVRLFNVTAAPPPPPERELDLDTLWGDAADGNIRLVNGLLTRIQAHDAELHDRLLPYVQRHAGTAEHLLAVAKRLAERAGRR